MGSLYVVCEGSVVGGGFCAMSAVCMCSCEEGGCGGLGLELVGGAL